MLYVAHGAGVLIRRVTAAGVCWRYLVLYVAHGVGVLIRRATAAGTCKSVQRLGYTGQRVAEPAIAVQYSA
eukprot:1149263-Pelagomonas_calceolata.AAC.2